MVIKGQTEEEHKDISKKEARKSALGQIEENKSKEHFDLGYSSLSNSQDDEFDFEDDDDQFDLDDKDLEQQKLLL